MPVESRRTTELRKIFELPEAEPLPAYADIETFTSDVQQSRAVSLFPDSWQFHRRVADSALRSSFSRIVPHSSVTWRQVRGIYLPEGAPVHDRRIDKAGYDETSQALTLIMGTADRLVPGD